MQTSYRGLHRAMIWWSFDIVTLIAVSLAGFSPDQVQRLREHGVGGFGHLRLRLHGLRALRERQCSLQIAQRFSHLIQLRDRETRSDRVCTHRTADSTQGLMCNVYLCVLYFCAISILSATSLYLYSVSEYSIHYIPVKYLHFSCNVFIFSF